MADQQHGLDVRLGGVLDRFDVAQPEAPTGMGHRGVAAVTEKALNTRRAVVEIAEWEIECAALLRGQPAGNEAQMHRLAPAISGDVCATAMEDIARVDERIARAEFGWHGLVLDPIIEVFPGVAAGHDPQWGSRTASAMAA